MKMMRTKGFEIAPRLTDPKLGAPIPGCCPQASFFNIPATFAASSAVSTAR